MFNDPFAVPGSGQAADLQALARQYWAAWGEAMRSAGAAQTPIPGAHAWSDALNFFSQLAHGGRSEADHALDSFNRQAREWFSRMQQVAAEFAGQSADARQIVDAWRKALGASSENPFPEMFRAMRADAMPGLGQWAQDATPYLDSLRREMHANLSLPTFGLLREHQERLQGLARAQLDYQQRSAAFNGLLAKSGQRAFEVFEDMLVQREEPGRQIGSARALFDLWVDAAEEAFAETALTEEFRELYGALVNAQMRLRVGIQREVELFCEQFGIPGRTEVDSAHRKITELQRELRRLRQQLGDAPVQRQTAAPVGEAAVPQRSKPVASKSAAKKTATRKAAKKATVRATAPATAKVAGSTAKPATKSAKKASKKASKKIARKAKKQGAAVKKAAGKASKAAASRTGKAPAKTAKKTARKAANKAARKATKKAAGKAASRSLLAGIPMPTAPRDAGTGKGGR